MALARALAIQPRVLLLDEPFGALDAKVRQELRSGCGGCIDEIHMTSVFVTHDQEEAFEVADRVVVMNHGRIEQIGTPEEVFEHPANPFVMDFLGNVNVFHGRVQNGRAHLGNVEVDCPDYPHQESRSAVLYVRPHELDIEHSPNGAASLKAQRRAREPERLGGQGGAVGGRFRSRLERRAEPRACLELALKTGDTVYVSPRRVHVFVPEYVI